MGDFMPIRYREKTCDEKLKQSQAAVFGMQTEITTLTAELEGCREVVEKSKRFHEAVDAYSDGSIGRAMFIDEFYTFGGILAKQHLGKGE